MFVRKLLLGFGFIWRDAENDRVDLVELLVVVTKLGRFNGSTGRIGLGVKVENDGLALEILQRHLVAVLVQQRKVWGFIIDVH